MLKGDSIRICNRCLTPSTRPRIQFDENGVCNACLNVEVKKHTDWGARRNELLELLSHNTKKGMYDCVVPFSGGKDSATVAHKLKFDLGLKPLLVTFAPMIGNQSAQNNRKKMIDLGFDHFIFTPDTEVIRRLARRFFIERGNPKVPWEAGVNALPIRVALQNRISLVFYAEHGETEYGGKILHPESAKRRDFTEVIEHQIGDHPMNWMDEKISYRDLAPYLYPDAEEFAHIPLQVLYFAYFFRWSMFDNYHYIREKFDFEACPQGRTIGTFTNFDSLDDKIDDLYYYLQYVKFGFGRCVRDASRLIQNGHLSREEGLEYVRKYDGEFPSRYLDEVLSYLELDLGEFMDVIDKHRNQELWTFQDRKWKLRFEYR